jgi:hypothetical protein
VTGYCSTLLLYSTQNRAARSFDQHSDLVGDTYHNTNRSVLVAAPEITFRPVGARQFVVGDRR